MWKENRDYGVKYNAFNTNPINITLHRKYETKECREWPILNNNVTLFSKITIGLYANLGRLRSKILCDQIGLFIGLLAYFKAFGNNSIAQIPQILRQFW